MSERERFEEWRANNGLDPTVYPLGDFVAWKAAKADAAADHAALVAEVEQVRAEYRDLYFKSSKMLDEIESLRRSRDFYGIRCEALQRLQNLMRDPERQAVCEILANGATQALAATESDNK